MDRSGARALGGWEPSNTHPPNTRVLVSGVDTLHLGYLGRLREDVANSLEERRARLLAIDASARTPWEGAEAEVRIGDLAFSFQPHAKNGYRFLLTNGDATLLIRAKPVARVPLVIVQLRSHFLWTAGWMRAAAIAGEIAALLLEPGSLEEPMVSRVDLCADFQGWVPLKDDLDRFVCRADYRTAHNFKSNLSGFTFGRDGISARLYDKSREILRSGKEWMRAVWASGPLEPSLPVWRLEYQLRRRGLRDRGLGTFRELATRAGDLWRYLHESWLRLVLVDERTRPERCPTDPSWLALGSVTLPSVGCPVVRRTLLLAEEKRFITGMKGHLTSWAARNGITCPRRAWALAGRHLLDHLRQHRDEFTVDVERKMRRLASALPVT